jgi:hypothetical protein
MNDNWTNTSTAMNTRRTGLDRRWISSSGHQPERRRGKDRRSREKRAFAGFPKLNGAGENRERFSDNPFEIKETGAKNETVPSNENGLPPAAEIVPKREPADDEWLLQLKRLRNSS